MSSDLDDLGLLRKQNEGRSKFIRNILDQKIYYTSLKPQITGVITIAQDGVKLVKYDQIEPSSLPPKIRENHRHRVIQGLNRCRKYYTKGDFKKADSLFKRIHRNSRYLSAKELKEPWYQAYGTRTEKQFQFEKTKTGIEFKIKIIKSEIKKLKPDIKAKQDAVTEAKKIVKYVQNALTDKNLRPYNKDLPSYTNEDKQMGSFIRKAPDPNERISTVIVKEAFSRHKKNLIKAQEELTKVTNQEGTLLSQILQNEHQIQALVLKANKAMNKRIESLKQAGVDNGN